MDNISSLLAVLRIYLRYMPDHGFSSEVIEAFAQSIEKHELDGNEKDLRQSVMEFTMHISDWRPRVLGQKFLEDVRTETGRDLCNITGDFSAFVNDVISKKKITNDEDYYLLSTLLEGEDRSLRSKSKRKKISDMLDEHSVRKG